VFRIGWRLIRDSGSISPLLEGYPSSLGSLDKVSDVKAMNCIEDLYGYRNLGTIKSEDYGQKKGKHS
jgi:hypothetical protein